MPTLLRLYYHFDLKSMMNDDEKISIKHCILCGYQLTNKLNSI